MDSQEKTVTMTESEVELLVERTVLHTFERFGIDPDDPIEVQKDFSFVRDWRKSVKAVRSKALITAVGIVVVGIAAALWLGFKTILVR